MAHMHARFSWKPLASPNDISGTLEPPDRYIHSTGSPTAAPAFGWPRLRNCGRRCSSRGHGCMKVNSGGGPEAGLSLSRASIWLAAAASVSHRDCCRVTGSSLQECHTSARADGSTHHPDCQLAIILTATGFFPTTSSRCPCSSNSCGRAARDGLQGGYQHWCNTSPRLVHLAGSG